MKHTINSYKGLFNFLSDNRKSYVAFESFVKIESGKVTKIDYAYHFFGQYDESDLSDEIESFEDFDEDILNTDGYYQFNGVASVHGDDNGVGHCWTYLEFEYIDITFAISITKHENEQKVFESDIDSVNAFFDLNI
jgi:hypothetical protein